MSFSTVFALPELDVIYWTIQVATPGGSKAAFFYDPGAFELGKGWFPFRNNHFVVNSEKVRDLAPFMVSVK